MGKPTPEILAAPGTEHAHQVALMCALNGYIKEFPELRWVYAVPNGGERDRAVAGRLKAEGVKSGVYDLALPVARGGFHGLYVEMKKPERITEKHGGMSDSQLEFGTFLKSQNYCGLTAHSWEIAVKIFVGYLRLPPTIVVPQGVGATSSEATGISPPCEGA